MACEVFVAREKGHDLPEIFPADIGYGLAFRKMIAAHGPGDGLEFILLQVVINY